MADTEEPQQQSIQARIAALNLGQVGRNPTNPSQGKTSPRPPPPKPPIDRSATVSIPVASTTIANGIGNEPRGPSRAGPPPLPTRKESSSTPTPPPRLPQRRESAQSNGPTLPPRRPSELSRRTSQESVSSVVSSISAVSNGTSRSTISRGPSMDNARVRAPVYDPSTLPPLPPSRKSQQEKESNESATGKTVLKTAKSSSFLSVKEIKPAPTSPTLPKRPGAREPSPKPALPFRPPLPERSPTLEPPLPARRLPPTTIPPVRPRTDNTPPVPQRPSASDISRNGIPPPIPSSTRPDLSKLMATKPKFSVTQPTPQATSSNCCLKCRDFSGPDNHAARFPRQNVPSLNWLAEQLTSPFPSPTDKARAIFVWLHLNIDYNVDAFFNNAVKPSTPASTLDTGLAVCEGYAALFTALATKAGLESVVVGGHGKGMSSYCIINKTKFIGFGYKPLRPGEPLPEKKAGHAWNAVKIDNGEWKLIDSCWGAGYVQGAGQPYQRKFNTTEFTKSNEDFGLTHYPMDLKYLYRSDGRILTWEQYYIGEQAGAPVNVFADPNEGFSNASYLPKQLHVSSSPSAHMGPTVRFQFERICPHWDPRRNGKGLPYLYVLCLGTQPDGSKNEWVPFKTNGKFWWVDVAVEQLGRPGEKITCYSVATVGDHDGRGLSKEEYLMAKGRKGMSFQGFATWEIV
jgi:transglutaminase-like putative cysteine protease